MRNRWLAFFTIAILGIMVFIFFSLRLKPIEIKNIEATVEPGSIEEPTVTFVNPSKGAKDAKITIIEFSDFECDACKTLNTSLDVVLKTYPEQTRVVWKNLPNESMHEKSTPAAIAAHCAHKQGKFWEYHDELFKRQDYLNESQFEQIASMLNLEIDSFKKCYEQNETLPIVRKDYEEGIALGVTSTPTIYVGKDILIGAVTLQEVLDLVESKL